VKISELAVAALVVIAAAGAFAFAFFFVMVLKRIRLSTVTIRAVGIILVVVAVCALAIATQLDATAAVGVLGAVAGYLFGAASSGDSSSVSAGDVGDGNTIVGRDLNQWVDELKAETVHLAQAVSSLNQVTAARESTGILIVELVNRKVAFAEFDEYTRELQSVIRKAHEQGEGLVATLGPYDSRLNDFTSTILIFQSPHVDGVSRRTVDGTGVERAS